MASNVANHDLCYMIWGLERYTKSDPIKYNAINCSVIVTGSKHVYGPLLYTMFFWWIESKQINTIQKFARLNNTSLTLTLIYKVFQSWMDLKVHN